VKIKSDRIMICVTDEKRASGTSVSLQNCLVNRSDSAEGFFLMVLCSLSSRRESCLPFLDTLSPNQLEIRIQV